MAEGPNGACAHAQAFSPVGAELELVAFVIVTGIDGFGLEGLGVVRVDVAS